MQIDDIDRKILRVLQRDASLTNNALAQQLGLSSNAVWRRIERMERSGIIEGQTLDIDPRALGFEVEVSLRITLDKTQRGALPEFIAAARLVPEIDTVQTLLGRVDVRLNVITRDLAHYQQIYRDKILALPHIADIEALMLLSELKNSQDLPL